MNNGIQLLILLGISLICFSSFANDKQNARPGKYQRALKKSEKIINKKTASDSKPLKKIKYIPPYLGAPSTNRLSGMGVRSSEKQIEFLFSALTPTHLGLTSLSQPNLFWFISKPISESFQFIEFVLNSEDSITPLIRTRLSQLEKSGIHQLNLAEFDIKLKPGIEYSWSIALVKNPQARSLDIVSSSKIKYVKPDKKLQLRLQKSSGGQRASIYAQTGYWYEAIATAIRQPKEYYYNLTLLLDQVGLQKIAKNLVENNL